MYPQTKHLKVIAVGLMLGTLLLQAVVIPNASIMARAQTSTAGTKAEADQLLDEGEKLFQASQYPTALEKFQKARGIYRQVGDRRGEATTLGIIGFLYINLGEKQKALEFYNQAPPLWKAVGDQRGEAYTLGIIGSLYSDLGNKQKALEFYSQALPLFKAVGDQRGEASMFQDIGSLHSDLGDKQKALKFYSQALPLFKAVGDQRGEAITLTKTGKIYYDLEEWQKALEFLNQALPLFKAEGYPRGEAITLTAIGLVYSALGEQQRALEFYIQALPLSKAAGDRKGEASTLVSIGFAYSALGEQQKALTFYNQSLPLFKVEGDLAGEATTLNNIGGVYSALGDKQKALDFYNQALPLSKAAGDPRGQANTLNNIGRVYDAQGQKQKAVEFYIQALPLRKIAGDRRGEAATLNNIGLIYSAIGEQKTALTLYNQALLLSKAAKDRRGEAATLNNIGLIYSALREQQKALYYYNQALLLTKAVGNRSGEATTLSNVAFLLSEQKQITLAITFYKQTVNLTESLRKDIQSLPREVQQTYLQTVEGYYRNLAQLLLQQGRIMEALQVLDLLKVQELQDFFKDVKGNDRTAQGIELFSQEKQILSQLNTPSIPDLYTYLNSPTVNTLAQQLQTTAAAQNLTLKAYTDLQTRLKTLSSNAALLYPLILDNSLELVLFTPNRPPIHKTVKVSKNQLEQSIAAFRNDIQRPDLDLKPEAQKLYTWLLKPLEPELAQANIQTIIYAPDGQLRYVPLAALYDGQRWAIEKYQVNYVTAFALTSLKPRSTQNPRVLAAAYTEPKRTSVMVNQKLHQFDPIPGAILGVKRLAQQYPQTTVLLDKAFNTVEMASNRINGYGIVHLATHGKLVSGSPEDSFIALNNGESITLRDLKNWQLPNVDLVVLSACQTALGENPGNGIEILGFGYQLQIAQARAAIASLWRVSDDKTNRLMDLFYEQLKTGKYPPAQALAMAQRAMIQEGKSDNNPFYWAPFILIGNGL